MVLMLLWVMGVGFQNTRTVSENLNASRIMSRLHEWDSNMLSFLIVIAEHSVMVLKTPIRYPLVANSRFSSYKIFVQKQ